MQRLTNDDRNWGPLTIGPWRNRFALHYRSGGDEEGCGCNYILAVTFGWAIRIKLPNLMKPFVIRHRARWDEATIKRIGRDWYEEAFERSYGFSFSEGALHVDYGPQTHDSETTRTKVYFYPWRGLRRVRETLYHADGNPALTHLGNDRSKWLEEFEATQKAKESLVTESFYFRDHDNELITAKCHIREIEYARGEGLFKWLGWVLPNRIYRSMEIEFSGEVGPEKGSWKGGTIGHSCDIAVGESCATAFRRYCENGYRLKYVGHVMTPVLA